MTGPAIVLASASPRRRELLERLGLRPRVIPADIDERALPGEAPVAFARRMAREKAEAVAVTLAGTPDEGSIVVAADTVVHLEGQIYGKPRDRTDATRILRALSGREHIVTTGICARVGDRERVLAVSTRVCFLELTDAVIAGYIATGEPSDKAGAYGIQGIGAALVAGIVGSYTNVVGLPLAEILSELMILGAPHPLSEVTS